MEMFNLTKNHKGDILISGATSKYSMRWAISERPEADLCGPAQSADMPSLCDNLERELQASLLQTQPGHLAQWPRSVSSLFPCRFPRLDQRLKLWERADKPQRNLCEMAVLSGLNKLHRENACFLSWPWLEPGGLGWGGGESQGPLFRRNLPAAGLVRRRRQTQCCCCWFDL